MRHSMWNQRKKTRRPEYSYAPIGSRWVVYHWIETGNISTADKVDEFPPVKKHAKNVIDSTAGSMKTLKRERITSRINN